MSEAIKLSRRAFLVQSSVAGAGLLLGFHLPAQRKLAAATLEGVNADQPVEVNAWIDEEFIKTTSKEGILYKRNYLNLRINNFDIKQISNIIVETSY